MKVIDDLKIKVTVDLKELADLEDRSIKTVDGEQKKIFTIEEATIVKKTVFSSSKETGIVATAIIVFNNSSSTVENEINALLKKLLKIKI